MNSHAGAWELCHDGHGLELTRLWFNIAAKTTNPLIATQANHVRKSLTTYCRKYKDQR